MSQFRSVFIGTYTEPILFGTGQILYGQGRGIYVYRFNTSSGALEPSYLEEGVRNASYLAIHPSKRVLYAVNEYKEFAGKPSGAISAFTLDPDTGQLSFINQKATGGTDPCHLVVTDSGHHVLVANFASGGVGVLPISSDGSLGDLCDYVQHRGSSVNAIRQTGPHAHSVTLDRRGQLVFVPDLGMDKVMAYQLDDTSGRLTPHSTPWTSVLPGAGPRQLVMHPGGDFAYLINELASTMTAFRYDEAQGALVEIETVSTLPAGFSGSNSCAEVQISPSGDLLFGSNRGHDSLVVYAIDRGSGRLTTRAHIDTRGEIPRNFTVVPDGNWIIVANQDSNSLTVFRIDHDAKTLIPVGDPVSVPTPVCVKVL